MMLASGGWRVLNAFAETVDIWCWQLSWQDGQGPFFSFMASCSYKARAQKPGGALPGKGTVGTSPKSRGWVLNPFCGLNGCAQRRVELLGAIFEDSLLRRMNWKRHKLLDIV